jgi:hypothetical protein
MVGGWRGHGAGMAREDRPVVNEWFTNRNAVVHELTRMNTNKKLGFAFHSCPFVFIRGDNFLFPFFKPAALRRGGLSDTRR